MKKIISIISLLVGLFLVSTVFAVEYQIIDLGTLGGGSWAYGINNFGQAVGHSTYVGSSWAGNAVLWDNGSIIDLQTLGGDSSIAYDINDSGQVVGWSINQDGLQRAFLWENGTMIDLGAISATTSQAFAINNRGQVVGNSGESFIWSQENGMQGSPCDGHAWDINNNGVVVGSIRSGNVVHPCVDGLDLCPSCGTSDYANAINDLGQVVGGTSGGGAWIWDSLNGMRGLPGLSIPNNYDGSWATDINNSGQVVGSSKGRAVLWENGQVIDLNSFVPPLSGWFLSTAEAINNYGQIIGKGSKGISRAYLLTPIVPDISVTPTSHNFGSVNVGSSSSPQAFTVSNTGTGDLHISSITLSDTTNYSLDINGGSSPCGSTTPTIAPDNSCTVIVTFSPLSTGQKDASLTINSDDPDTPTMDVSLSGTGVEPDISIFPSLLKFGQVLVGNTSTAQTLTISNTGTGNLVISFVETTGTDASMFSVATGGTNPCPSLTPTIAPGGNCTVNVTFSPTSKAQKTATLSISSNDPDENPANVSLSGVGKIVKVTRPNGGETWTSGTTERITWQTTNPPPTTVAKHRLRYTLNGGTTWKTIVTRSGNSGWFDWKVASVLNIKKRGKVKVVLLDSLGGIIGSDVSDKVFTIHPVNGGSGGCTACH